MVKSTVFAALLSCLTIAAAGAKSWDAPTLVAELRGTSTTNLFPGSDLSTPDRGLEGVLHLETARRLSATMKLGLDAELAGEAWSKFGEASFAEVMAGVWLRRAGTTVRVEGTLTPSRLKFPATLEGGRFARVESRLGIRQVLTTRLRLRLEGRAQRDDFVPAYDVRDGQTGEAYGQLTLRASEAVTLRVDALAGRTSTNSPKYAHADHTVGGAIAVSRGPWGTELAVTSGLSRYDKAQVADSNHRRRDQTLETRLQLERTVGNGFTALVAGTFFDQTSSRTDRTYQLHRLQLGLAWRPTAP